MTIGRAVAVDTSDRAVVVVGPATYSETALASIALTGSYQYTAGVDLTAASRVAVAVEYVNGSSGYSLQLALWRQVGSTWCQVQSQAQVSGSSTFATAINTSRAYSHDALIVWPDPLPPGTYRVGVRESGGTGGTVTCTLVAWRA